MSISFWVCAIITAVSAFTSLGFSIAAYKVSSKTSRANSMYTAARSISLTFISLVPFFNKSASWLIAVALTMILVQFLDALIGVKLHEKIRVIGPTIAASINLFALVWFINA